jgi:hypothetical protein
VSHAHRDLAIFAEIGLRAGQLRLNELEYRRRFAGRPVPQFGGKRRDAQDANVGIARPLPPHRVRRLPDFGGLRRVASRLPARADGEVSLSVRFDKDETDLMLGLDLVLLGAPPIGDEPDHAGGTVRPRLHGPRAQAGFAPRCQHAHANALDDVPNAIEMRWIDHARPTEVRPSGSRHTSFRSAPQPRLGSP